jgi:hypothetical protein
LWIIIGWNWKLAITAISFLENVCAFGSCCFGSIGDFGLVNPKVSF